MRPPAPLLGLSKDSDRKCLSGVPGGQIETPSSPGQLSGVKDNLAETLPCTSWMRD